MMKTGCLILAAAFVTGLFWYWYFYQREKKLISRLQVMVDQAREGTLCQGEISEERVSALENSLKQYLNESLLAGEKQEIQKRKIQELISDISHQTLTPVSNLKLYSQLLRERPGAESRELEIISEETEKLDFLIQSLVKLSRLEQGIIKVRPGENPVSELFRRARKQYSARAEEKGIELVVSETDETARFDMKWTGEALGNLIDNAVKYTPEGGRVQLQTEALSFFVRIDVTDTGIGVSQSELNKIFRRFYRGENSADQPGVGIGLYLAREIAQAQKGYIRAASQKGRGSVFSIFLPK
ncbi:HAMP domain-containing histidine kinase [bacterium 210820-DFI.6.37]|nr:HAMP domain-containing histidine kinase [bacterium 210820-DFI.6.37]